MRRVARELGYDPARLRGRKGQRLVFLLHRHHSSFATNPFFSFVLHGVEDACREFGIVPTLLTTGPAEPVRDQLRLHEPDALLVAGFFEAEVDGELPTDLVREFVSVNRSESRLEARFHFAADYRFATEGRLEEPEVSLARPVTVAAALPVQAPSILDRLAFSRVARSLHNDHALLYVEALRPDASGAGFLVWCRRQGRNWTLFDTEVAWTIQARLDPEEGPLLAP